MVGKEKKKPCQLALASCRSQRERPLHHPINPFRRPSECNVECGSGVATDTTTNRGLPSRMFGPSVPESVELTTTPWPQLGAETARRYPNRRSRHSKQGPIRCYIQDTPIVVRVRDAIADSEYDPREIREERHPYYISSVSQPRGQSSTQVPFFWLASETS